MSPNFHFSELLRIFNAHGVKYLVVGGYAVMLYSEPRFTKDLDLWVGDDRDNASRVFRALAEFGAPLTGVDPADFAKPDLIYQLGVPPLRIDVLTSISGVDFEAAWSGAVRPHTEMSPRGLSHSRICCATNAPWPAHPIWPTASAWRRKRSGSPASPRWSRAEVCDKPHVWVRQKWLESVVVSGGRSATPLRSQ